MDSSTVPRTALNPSAVIGMGTELFCVIGARGIGVENVAIASRVGGGCRNPPPAWETSGSARDRARLRRFGHAIRGGATCPRYSSATLRP